MTQNKIHPRVFDTLTDNAAGENICWTHENKNHENIQIKSCMDNNSKVKRIISSQSDAIGYLYRKGNQNILSFATSDSVACGARPEHLRNAEIVLSEMVDGNLVTHWDKVYID